jgi:hypothetical protein
MLGLLPEPTGVGIIGLGRRNGAEIVFMISRRDVLVGDW